LKKKGHFFYFSVYFCTFRAVLDIKQSINLLKNTAMVKTITFNELRKIKDSLPSGSSQRIADQLGISVETVRNYFGGSNYRDGKSAGVHIEPGPDGGLVMLDDTIILDIAMEILEKHKS
jgi:hypothetical protein